MKVRNTFAIFIVSGFWHGANWTFIIWGALNALYFLPLLLSNKNRNYLDIVAKGKTLPSLKEFMMILLTFSMTVFAWIFFRAESVSHAISYITAMLTPQLFSMPHFVGMGMRTYTTIVLLIIFILVEWRGREGQYAIAELSLKWNRPVRFAMYTTLVFVILWFGGQEQQFIYFQF